VEVFQLGGVRTPIIGRPRPLPRQRRADHLYTLNCEEPDSRTLIVRDNGIGMTREEVVDLIGTLARSGTAELRQKLREAKHAAASEELIGQLCIGFYSTFMVADKV